MRMVYASPLALSLPVAMGYVPLGAVFGYLFVQAGGAWWLAMATSLLVYAGAMQFAMIPMLVAGLPVASLAVAALVINLRHAFYGLSLLHDRPRSFLLRWYLVFALTDETYSVLTAVKPKPTDQQMVLLAFVNQGWWILGTAIGAVLGGQLPVSLTGLEFALAALFAVLTVEQWRAARTTLPLIVAIVSYVLAWWRAPTHALLLAILLCVVLSVLWAKRREQFRSGDEP
jgi:4-azaleucine resistance transporter AzlC